MACTVYRLYTEGLEAFEVIANEIDRSSQTILAVDLGRHPSSDSAFRPSQSRFRTSLFSGRTLPVSVTIPRWNAHDVEDRRQKLADGASVVPEPTLITSRPRRRSPRHRHEPATVSVTKVRSRTGVRS